MVSVISFRSAEKGDYDQFRVLEESTWSRTGLAPISYKTFCAWIETHQKGFVVAVKDDESIVGHSYSQVCDFDPHDETEQRSYNEVTGGGTTVGTHDPQGSALYVVSVSAVSAGVGRRLILAQFQLTEELDKKYCVGSCRISGFSAYLRQRGVVEADEREVQRYVSYVERTAKRKLLPTERRVLDPVLTPFLSIHGMRRHHMIKDFSDDEESLGWACVISWKNTP